MFSLYKQNTPLNPSSGGKCHIDQLEMCHIERYEVKIPFFKGVIDEYFKEVVDGIFVLY